MPSNREKSEHYGALQQVIDQLFGEEDSPGFPEEPAGPVVSRLQVVMAAESADLPDDLLRIVNLLPPGEYTRQKLTIQLNSAISGHAWGQEYGTVG